MTRTLNIGVSGGLAGSRAELRLVDESSRDPTGDNY